MTPKTTITGRLTALLVGVVILIGVSEGLLRLVFPHWREFYSGWFMTVSHVPDYGVVATGKPGFDGYFAQNNGDFRVRFRINKFGLRNDEPVNAANGRLWVIGDSMAFGWGVERDETYTAIIAQKTGVATYSIASPGANVCGYQALVGRMPASIRPSAVIVGLILENDVADYDCSAMARQAAQEMREKKIGGEESSVTIPLSFISLKRTLTRISALYNFFAVAVKRVDVFQELLIRVGMIERAHHDHAAPATRNQDELVRKTVRELTRLRDMFPRIPVAVLIAPGRFEIRDGDQNYIRLRQGIGAALKIKNISVIDPIDRFRKAGLAATHFVHDGHWSVLGHRIAGEVAETWVKSLQLPVTSPSAASAKP